MTVSINETQHNSIECGYAEYRLYIVMPSVIRMSVVTLNVIVLSAVAPLPQGQ